MAEFIETLVRDGLSFAQERTNIVVLCVILFVATISMLIMSRILDKKSKDIEGDQESQ